MFRTMMNGVMHRMVVHRTMMHGMVDLMMNRVMFLCIRETN